MNSEISRHDQSPTTELLGIGPTAAGWLSEVGIETVGQLRAIGPVPAFRLVQRLGVQPSLNLLWVLDASLVNEHWLSLSDARKAELRDILAGHDA